MSKRKLLIATCISGLLLGTSVPAVSGLQCGLAALFGLSCSESNLAIPFMAVSGHEKKVCAASGGFSCMDTPASLWLDPGMIVATGVDMLATKKVHKTTVDAKKAGEQLKEALGDTGSGSSGGGGASTSAETTAAVYAPEDIIPVIELENVSAKDLFVQVRTKIEDYLFKTSDAGIVGECTKTAEECARSRESEWLLASIALSESTADKILNITAKQGLQDNKSEAEKSVDERGKTTSSSTKVSESNLKAHFQKLIDNFNSEKSPRAAYNALADIVLDTHRPVNEANLLMARDLEAQGLAAAYESGIELLKRAETEE